MKIKSRKEYWNKYYRDHREEHIKCVIKYQSKHIKEISRRLKIYNQNNRKKILVTRKLYRQTPKFRAMIKAMTANRRGIGKYSKLTTKTIQEVYEQNIKCFGTLTCELCFQPIKFGEDNLEHFIPIARYSEFPEVDLNARENLGVAHSQFSKQKCNAIKRCLTLDEWFKKYPKFYRSDNRSTKVLRKVRASRVT